MRYYFDKTFDTYKYLGCGCGSQFEQNIIAHTLVCPVFVRLRQEQKELFRKDNEVDATPKR